MDINHFDEKKILNQTPKKKMSKVFWGGLKFSKTSYKMTEMFSRQKVLQRLFCPYKTIKVLQNDFYFHVKFFKKKKKFTGRKIQTRKRNHANF
jgi:hypothetical protein